MRDGRARFEALFLGLVPNARADFWRCRKSENFNSAGLKREAENAKINCKRVQQGCSVAILQWDNAIAFHFTRVCIARVPQFHNKILLSGISPVAWSNRVAKWNTTTGKWHIKARWKLLWFIPPPSIWKNKGFSWQKGLCNMLQLKCCWSWDYASAEAKCCWHWPLEKNYAFDHESVKFDMKVRKGLTQRSRIAM